MEREKSKPLAIANRPHLALTLGDPAGIGPEIVLKALADPRVGENCQIAVIGSRRLLERAYQDLRGTGAALADPDSMALLEVPTESTLWREITWGKGTAASGEASFTYLETAIDRTLRGEFHGIVTAPIAKSGWKAAGRDYPGQTELLAWRTGVEKFAMLFVARSPQTGWTLRTLLATTHIPLKQVPQALTPQLMGLKLDLLVECLRGDFGIRAPEIAIAGLNPHSGEGGCLGREEEDWLIPWLEGERQERPSLKLVGPVPADTLWVEPGRAWQERGASAADAYLALYHDQGLIPVKLMAFDRAVNTTLGLPFIRTSPDHGTAFDIAGRGIASATSLKAAIALAAELARSRGARSGV